MAIVTSKANQAEVCGALRGDFEEQVPAVLGRLRDAMAGVISSIPVAGRIKRASDLQRVLGIGSTLAWQVFRVATADNPLEEGRGVPGPMAMERFLDAATKRGVPAVSVAQVRGALAAFQDLVRVHAGSRATFDSMVGGLSVNGAEELDLLHKRAAFRANSHFLGARARASLACMACQPSLTDPNMLDSLSLIGLAGLSTQRRSASWGLASVRHTDDDGTPYEVEGIEPLDPAGTRHGIAFFRDFCSEPLPPFKVLRKRDGSYNVRLDGELIDQQSALTLILGFVSRSMSVRYRAPDDQFLGAAHAMRIPSEVLINDILVRDDLSFNGAPAAELFHGFDCDPNWEPFREHDRLAMHQSVTYLGRGPEVLETNEVPRYPEMMREAMRRAGWDPSRFAVYRCRVEYPIVPSLTWFRFDLAEKQAGG
jgi:hypothetical protein